MSHEKSDLRVLTEKEEATRKRRQENTDFTKKAMDTMVLPLRRLPFDADPVALKLQREGVRIAEAIKKDREKAAEVRKAKEEAADKIKEARRMVSLEDFTLKVGNILNPDSAKEADDAAEAKKNPSKWDNLKKMFKM